MRKYIGRQELNRIGDELVCCSAACAAVNRDQPKGILPRCLFLEERRGPAGAIVIGLNPGVSTFEERNYYRDNGMTYRATVEYWEDRLQNKHPYYKRLRKLVDQVGIDGPVLWTELVKCENAEGYVGPLPEQTYRVCVGAYLKRELRVIPQDWIAFAVGREAYKAAAYLLSDRHVVGVPHPTGSRGQFAGLFGQGQLNDVIQNQVAAVRASIVPLAFWLTADGEHG